MARYNPKQNLLAHVGYVIYALTSDTDDHTIPKIKKESVQYIFVKEIDCSNLIN